MNNAKDSGVDQYGNNQIVFGLAIERRIATPKGFPQRSHLPEKTGGDGELQRQYLIVLSTARKAVRQGPNARTDARSTLNSRPNPPRGSAFLLLSQARILQIALIDFRNGFAESLKILLARDESFPGLWLQ
jgi:hypothetical protein